MTPALVVLAVIVAGGAVVAMSAREPRFAALGALVALLGAPYVADPMPGSVALAARLVGVVLGGYLVWIALRRAPVAVTASAMGWRGATAVAVAAFAAGWLAAIAIGDALGGVAGEGPSPAISAAALASGSPVADAALAAAVSLITLAASPVLITRDVLRLGLGLLLLIAAAELLLASLGGPAADATELAFGVLIAAAAAGTAALVARSVRLHGDLELRPQSARERAVRTRAVDDAHPTGRRP